MCSTWLNWLRFSLVLATLPGGGGGDRRPEILFRRIRMSGRSFFALQTYAPCDSLNFNYLKIKNGVCVRDDEERGPARCASSAKKSPTFACGWAKSESMAETKSNMLNQAMNIDWKAGQEVCKNMALSNFVDITFSLDAHSNIVGSFQSHIFTNSIFPTSDIKLFSLTTDCRILLR